MTPTARSLAHLRALPLRERAELWLADNQRPQDDGCIVFTRARDGNGYGMISLWDKEAGRTVGYRAHRLALEVKLGRVLRPGEVARHTCDNPPCVNPDHLLPGTEADNHADAVERGRTARGEGSGRSRFTEEEVRDIKRRLAKGELPRLIAAGYSCSISAIQHIRYGRCWGWLAA